jgi:hypothetical protein
VIAVSLEPDEQFEDFLEFTQFPPEMGFIFDPTGEWPKAKCFFTVGLPKGWEGHMRAMLVAVFQINEGPDPQETGCGFMLFGANGCVVSEFTSASFADAETAARDRAKRLMHRGFVFSPES